MIPTEYIDEDGNEIEESNITHKIAVDDKIYDIKDENLDKLFIQQQNLSDDIADEVSNQLAFLAAKRSYEFFCTGVAVTALPVMLYQLWSQLSPTLTCITSASFCAFGLLQINRFRKYYNYSQENIDKLNEEYTDCSEQYQELIEHYKKQKTTNSCYDLTYN